MEDADIQAPDSQTPKVMAHRGATGLALGLVAKGLPVVLAGFVGDDPIADAIDRELQTAGVALDLMHLKQWTTFTKACLELQSGDGQKLDPQGRRLRRHKDERALPINGMSEYQAHLQNRAERYLRDASAIILVDYDLGSIAEPRALAFVARQLEVPCVAALGNGADADQYALASRQIDLSNLTVDLAVAEICSVALAVNPNQ